MKIAVVGGGIAGLGSAWLLEPKHDVHVFERARRLGGHTHTHVVPTATGRLPVDSGFIVYNEETYPLLTELFSSLRVRSRATNMSFSVECERCRVLWSGLGITGVFAKGSNAIDPRFLRFLAQVQKFHARGRSHRLTRELGMDDGRRSGSAIELQDLVAATAPSGPLGRHYVFPLASALWSTGIPDVRALPARFFIDFFRRHRLLQIRDRITWRTVVGGSQTYIDAMMTSRLAGRAHAGVSVRGVSRQGSEARLHFGDGSSQGFDRVVLATHADEALRLLITPSDRERELLGAWRYAESDTWLHSDPAYLPDAPSARASWNYRLADCHEPSRETTMTYNLNRLQGLETDTPFLVTLNPAGEPEHAHARMTYSHPIFTSESVATQPEIEALNGEHGTYFCGAYMGFGFHEDALRSAVQAVDDLGPVLA